MDKVQLAQRNSVFIRVEDLPCTECRQTIIRSVGYLGTVHPREGLSTSIDDHPHNPAKKMVISLYLLRKINW